IAFTAGGGTPAYQYSINNGSTYQAGATFNSLCANSYPNLRIRDANNCTLNLSTSITQPTALNLTQTGVTPATCGATNGTVNVSATGGATPYSYNIGATVNSTGAFTGLASGAHTVTVTDANLCTDDLIININSTAGPSPFVDVQTDVLCAGGLNGSVSIGVTGGTAAYQYALDGGGNQPS